VNRLIAGVPPRILAMLAVLLALLIAAPALLGGYGLSVLILVLYFAYVGQAWNIMMGFAGQLSLGHALYAGLGGYAAGVYFALLTIAFAEFTRIGFDNWPWAGGSGGMFLKIERNVVDIANLRGGPVLFYYVILILVVGTFVLCRALLESKLGRYWLAIREDAEAAQAVGVPVLRCKMLAVTISAALTAVAGVWNAFYYNNLFPETAFGISRSIEMTLSPIIGGLGTLFGPFVGAVVLTGLGEIFTDISDSLHIAGIKQIFYGLALLVIVMYRPAGIWPWLASRLGLVERKP
jgi:branched-chain amino acid transport system permease protein